MKSIDEDKEDKLATIVLIEDNLADIAYIEAILKQHRVTFNLCICRDGQEILDFLYKRGVFTPAKRPDLILLDLNLPKINGFQVLKILQNDQALKSLPVGIFSGSSFEEDVTHSFQEGARFYLRKPFKIGQFLASIRELKNLKLLNKEDSVMICHV